MFFYPYLFNYAWNYAIKKFESNLTGEESENEKADLWHESIQTSGQAKTDGQTRQVDELKQTKQIEHLQQQ